MNLRKLKLVSITVVIFVFLEFLYNVILTSLPFLTNLLIESIVHNENNFMIFLLLVEAILVIFSAMLYMIINILSEKVRYELEYKLKIAFLHNKKNDPIDKFSNSNFKNNYLYNSEKIVTNYYFMKIDIFIYTFAIISSFIFSALISWKIATLAFALNTIIIVIIFILKKKNAKIQKDYATNRQDFIENSSKIFDGAFDLRAFNRTENINIFLNKVNNVYYEKNKIVNKRSILYSSTIKISSIVVASVISLVTIIMSKAGIIGLYVIISLIAANTTMNAYIGNVFGYYGSLKSMNSLIDEINKLCKKDEIQNIKIFPILIKSLQINTRDKILNYPDICIEKNKKYFLRGKNGVGKSILLSAIQGVINFEKGNIRYNIYGKNQLSKKTISSKMICLQHEPLIFKGTILENLFISKKEWEGINDKFHFITKKINNPNLEATELSLGQKQMIAFLRSLIIDKELIIIDEGLAAISKNIRDKIESYLDGLNKTIIYVSHTTSTKLNWNEIFIY